MTCPSPTRRGCRGLPVGSGTDRPNERTNERTNGIQLIRTYTHQHLPQKQAHAKTTFFLLTCISHDVQVTVSVTSTDKWRQQGSEEGNKNNNDNSKVVETPACLLLTYNPLLSVDLVVTRSIHTVSMLHIQIPLVPRVLVHPFRVI